MSEKEPKPIGSGCFSFAAGVAFLLLFIGSYVLDLRKVDRYEMFQYWLLFAAIILIIWGSVRVAKVQKVIPDKWEKWEVGQSTLTFVVGVIAATVAIFAFVLGRGP